MNWESIGALGEIVAGVATLATLIYLSIQIRLNTKMLQSNLHAHWVEMASKGNTMRADHAEELARIFDSNVDDFKELPSAQKILLNAWIVEVVNHIEAAYLNHVSGVMDKGMFEAKQRNLELLLSIHPLCRSVWHNAKKGQFWNQDFVSFADAVVVPKLESRLNPVR